jgi:hypothetical protein
VITALEIQFRLLDIHRRGRGRLLFLFGAQILHLGIRRTNLVKHRFNDFPVRPRQHLPKDDAGYLYEKRLALSSIQARRLKPGIEGIDAHPGLHAV